MGKLLLCLSNSEGEVIASWSIGYTLESSFEFNKDFDNDPECDFYTDDSWNSPEDIGNEIKRVSRHYLYNLSKKQGL